MLDFVKNSLHRAVVFLKNVVSRLASPFVSFFKKREPKPVDPIFNMYYQEGSLRLIMGFHEVEINTPRRPQRVWFSFDDSDMANQISVDEVGVTIKPASFVITANIYSSRPRCLKWFAVLEDYDGYGYGCGSTALAASRPGFVGRPNFYKK